MTDTDLSKANLKEAYFSKGFLRGKCKCDVTSCIRDSPRRVDESQIVSLIIQLDQWPTGAITSLILLLHIYLYSSFCNVCS